MSVNQQGPTLEQLKEQAGRKAREAKEAHAKATAMAKDTSQAYTDAHAAYDDAKAASDAYGAALDAALKAAP